LFADKGFIARSPNGKARRATARQVAKAVRQAMPMAAQVYADAPRRRPRRRNRKNRNAKRNARRKEANRVYREVIDTMDLNYSPGLMQSVPNANFEPMMPASVGGMNLNLAGLGSTTSGQKWALKALHPNGEQVTASAGIPDHTHIPVVTPEYRVNHVIEGAGGTANDNVDIVFLGGPDLAALYRRYPVGTPGHDAWQPIYFRNANMNVVQSEAEGVDEGAIEHYWVSAGNTGITVPRARGMYAGMTVVFDAPALSDQGRLVAGQVGRPGESEVQLVEVHNIGTGFPVVEIEALSLGSIPLSEDDLFAASPGAIVHEAREGVYIPLRFDNPVHNFATLMPNRNGAATPLVYYRFGDADLSLLTFRGPDPTDPTVFVNYGTEGKFNFLLGVALFRGISPNANLSVKCRVGFEAQVESAVSPMAPFQHESPPLDREAMDAVTRVSQETPMAYPSCYNDSNGLFDVIKQVLGLIKRGGRVLGDLGVPIVGGIASGLDALGFSPGRNNRTARSALMRAAMRY